MSNREELPVKSVLIFIFAVIAATIVSVSAPWEFFIEIDTTEYKCLKSDCDFYPQVQPIVCAYFKNGKITKHEFYGIQSKIRKLRKIENDKNIDSIKNVFSRELCK